MKNNCLYIIATAFTLILGTLFFLEYFTKKAHTMNSTMIPKIIQPQEISELFPKSVEDIETLTKNTQKRALKQLNNLINIKKEDRNFENTVKALDRLSGRLNVDAAIITVLEMVSPNKDIRDAAQRAIQELTHFDINNFTQNEKLYQAYKDYVEYNGQKQDLTKAQRLSIKEDLKGFKKAGLELPTRGQSKLKEIKRELGVESIKFSSNIAKANKYITATKEELKGLPEAILNQLNKITDRLYKVGIDYPTFFAVMENVENESIRRKLLEEFNNRAYPENEKILNNIINLRDKLARLVGYKSFADLDIDNSMAGSVEAVDSFLSHLVKKSQQKASLELEEFKKDLPYPVKLNKDGKFNPWDLSYIKNYYKKKYLNIDENKIAEYFPLDSTLVGLFDIYERFFDLKFEDVNKEKLNGNLWHEDVKTLKVSKNGEFIGYVLLDLFPRDNKYSHACQVGIIHSTKDKVDNKEDYTPALVLVIANFPKPSKDTPALLKRNDVITFFHEFGHAIHTLLGTTELISQSGTNVKRDFVEMPSQMLEEWMWQPEILKKVSKHYKTGEHLTDELVDKIIKLKQFGSGNFILGQIFYSYLSLDLFKSGENKNIYKIMEDLYKEILPNRVFNKENHFYASFGHLMGYGAGYYGYLYSKVFAVDLFENIKEAGYFSGIGKKYVNDVLSKGGSDNPLNMIENFLGRKPNDKAFFKDLGLKS